MGRGDTLWGWLAEETELTAEPIPGQSLVEVAGDCRVLIENHFGVKAYSPEKIVVKVKWGCVQVCGSGLMLARMTREQLVIRGKIGSVCLQRRG